MLKTIALEPVSFVIHGACTPSFKMKRNEAKKIFQNKLVELYEKKLLLKKKSLNYIH